MGDIPATAVGGTHAAVGGILAAVRGTPAAVGDISATVGGTLAGSPAAVHVGGRLPAVQGLIAEGDSGQLGWAVPLHQDCSLYRAPQQRRTRP